MTIVAIVLGTILIGMIWLLAGSRVSGRILGWILAIIVSITLLFFGKSCWDDREKSEQATRNNPPTAPAPVVVVKKIGKEPTTYRFGDDGCVLVTDLGGDWQSYPKGGKIKFINPKTGNVVLRGEPGVNRGSSLPRGNYYICRDDDLNAWGVEIWR